MVMSQSTVHFLKTAFAQSAARGEPKEPKPLQTQFKAIIIVLIYVKYPCIVHSLND